MSEPDSAPEARIHRRRFTPIWLIPIVAALIAGYLGWRTLSARGPTVTVTFRSADGLVAHQTQVQHKAVPLGVVDSLQLSPDMSRVVVTLRMSSAAEAHLTDGARFWVVRPRVTGGGVSGLETLVSGAYIELDPGPAGGKSKRAFVGLDEPPGVRSDEPGTAYVLKADRLGALGIGSPVFFRDVSVGQVLSYDPPGLAGDITVHAFVRKPYDSYVHEGSRFWNTSGFKIQFGPQGVQLQMQSLQAVVAGGIAFDTPPPAQDKPPAPANAEFPLYASEDAATSATSRDRLDFVLYFRDPVRGLASGSAVEFYGQRVGNVTDVALQFDPAARVFQVRVRLAVEPDPLARAVGGAARGKEEVARDLIARGLRAQLQTANMLTGQSVVALDFAPNARKPDIRTDGEAFILPSEPGGGGLDGIVQSAGAFVAKLNRMPIDEIGANLNKTLASANAMVASPDLKQSMRSLSAALASFQDLARKADRDLTPALQRLPQIAENLDKAVARANAAVGSIESGYGRDSEFRRGLDRLMDQVNDAARSIRLLADFLDRHPEALVRGRTGKATER